jgi:hypothetical protein
VGVTVPAIPAGSTGRLQASETIIMIKTTKSTRCFTQFFSSFLTLIHFYHICQNGSNKAPLVIYVFITQWALTVAIKHHAQWYCMDEVWGVFVPQI